MSKLGNTITVLPVGTNLRAREKVTHVGRMFAALLLTGVALAGCRDDDEQQKNKNMQLVQGRDSCVAALVQYGRTKDEAEKICDEATAQAIIQNRLNGHDTQQAGGGGGGGGGGGNPFFWYWLGTQSHGGTTYVTAPTVYRRDTSSGNLSMVGGVPPSNGYTPPRSFSSEQMATYSMPPATRAAMSNYSRGGTPMQAEGSGSRVGGGSTPGESSFSRGAAPSESLSSSFGARGGMSAGIARGGFSGGGVSMGG